MADRKLNLNISADTTKLKADLTELSSQIGKLASVSATFASSFNESLAKAAIAQERLNAAAGQTLIIEERLAQASIKKAAEQVRADQAAIAGREKLNQAAAKTLVEEEKIAQALQRTAQATSKAAAEQQKATDQAAIAQQKILQATANRELAEKRVADASRKAAQQQVADSQKVSVSLQGVIFGFNNLVFGIQNFANIANSTFQSLVGGSIQLEQQLISIRGALAATNDVQVGGKSISDPLERINKLAPSVNKAIAQVRKDSIELANVTSDDLIGVFQIISGEVGNIGASLDDAASLTKAFGSSFSALGLPLAGARQEITSILQGTIDQNSALAKTLAINNTQIQQEKAKGTLVDFLLRKTSALAASQSLVAKTFGGVSSNIIEVVQRFQESFGKVVLPPVVEQLTKVYESLLSIQPQIETFIANTSKGFIEIGSNLKLVFDAVAPLFVEFGKTLGAIATASLPVLQAGFTLFLGTAIAVANLLTTVLTPVLQVIQSDFGKFAVSVGLVAIAFNRVIPVILTFTGQALQALLLTVSAVTASFTTLAGKAALTASFTQLAIGVNLATVALSKLQASLVVIASVAALAAVVVGAAFAWNQYSQAADAAKQTNIAFANSTNALLGLNTRLEKSIESLQEKQKKGTITPQELKALEGLLKLYKQGTDDIDAQIADQRKIIESNGLGSALGVSAEQTIKKLEEQKAKIQSFFDETAILGQKAVGQGALKEQFNTVSDNFFKEFKNGTNLAVTQAKGFIGVLQEEIELGVRSKESGLERLKALSQAEFLLKEDRVAAAKAATAIIDKENKRQIDSNASKQSEIQQQIESGELLEIDGIKRVSALKEEAKKLEIQGIDEKLKFALAGSDLERELINQRKKAVTDLNKIQQEGITQQVAALRAGLERELSANADLRKKAELATQADIQALKLGGFENERQLEEQSLLIKKQTIESEIADKRRVLEFDKTLLANFVGSQKEKEELILKIGSTEADIAKLNLDATDNLIARNKLLYEQKINNLEIEKTTTDRVSKLLESQNSVLSAQVKLQEAITNAQLKGAESRLSALKQADELLKGNREKAIADEQKQRDALRQQSLQGLSEEEKKKAEARFAEEDAALEAQKAAKQSANDREKERLTRERLAQLGINAGTSELNIARQIFDQEQKILALKARKFEQEQANAKRELEVQIQQSQIRDKQLQVEAKIALIKAKASGSDEAIASALELVAVTDEQVKSNQQIATLQRQTLDVTQKSEREAFNQEQGDAAFKSRIAGADAGLRGLQSSGNILAKAVNPNTAIPPSEATARGKLAAATTKDKVAAVQKERQQDLAAVADGSVAFGDTSQRVKDNFAALPDSLKKTKVGLQEVIAQAKELSENPIFKSRDQLAAKQAQAKAQQTQQTQQRQQQQAQIAQQVNTEAQTIEQKNAAITASNTRITNQNELGKAANKVFGGITSSAGIGDGVKAAQEQAVANQLREDRIKRARLLANRGRRNFFTGGLPPVGETVTVNERGQEAITNLQTLETSLLPKGERTVQFDAPVWVHNAIETRQIRNLGMLDDVAMPDISFGAIAGTLRINNAEVLNELRVQNTLLAQLADGIKKPNVINNFSNDPRPDLTAYRVANQLLRT